MNDNIELMKHIYKDAEMARFTLRELLQDLKEKDNKIKAKIEEIIEKYEDYIKNTKEKLLENKVEPEEEGFMAKMGANMGIKKEVKADNSDANIADMLIKGVSMGSVDIEKKIKDYKESANKETLKLAHSFLKFQQTQIEDLKKYL